MKKYLVFIIILVLIFSVNVKALEGKINPEWEKYNNLSLEEKKNYDVVPSKYIYEFISKRNNLYNIDKNDINLNHYKYSNDGKIPSKYSNEDSTLPSKFNLTNLNGKNYVNTITKDQGELGLCVVFGVFGSVESNMLYKGIKNEDDVVSKCNNDNSRHCRIKSDLEINEKYKNGELTTNATFSERNIDYVSSIPNSTKVYNGGSGLYNIVTEKYNPYHSDRGLGYGFSVLQVEELFSYGVGPKRALDVWKNYDSNRYIKSLKEIYDNVSQDYIVTDYVQYYSRPSGDTNISEWMNSIKKDIVEYGARAVSLTRGPSSTYAGSCYFYDSKNGKTLLNIDNKCGVTARAGHAMQIIGWDDDYEYSYCRLSKSTSDLYTQATCESNGYEWISGKGVWILRNSWGASSGATYVYVTYDTKDFLVSGARSVDVVNYDNIYNEKVSLVEKQENVNKNTLIYKYYKPNQIESLARISFIFNTYLNEYTISVSNDGVNYKNVVTDVNDYAGLKSFKVDNYILDKESFYVKIISNKSIEDIYIPSVFTTNNYSSDISIKTYLKNRYINKNKVRNIDVRSEVYNINSGSKLVYKIFDENNNDVTNNFVIENNYVVTNNNIANISFDENISNGKYTLKTYYGDVIDSIVFNIVDKDVIKLFVKEPVFVEDNTANVNYDILIDDTTDYRWFVSDNDVATIDDGVLNIKKSGKITITLTVNTPDGDTSNSIELVVFDEKITTPQEFINILKESSKYYYIMNDLDFTGVNYDSFNNGSQLFYGFLDGGFHTISNVSKNNSNKYGTGTALIPALNGTVRNLIIEDSYFVNTNNSNNAGGVVADLLNYSVVENILIKNTVVQGSSIVGGIVGEISSFGKVKNCVFEGDVKAISDSGDVYAGGIVGHTIIGEVYNSYNEGDVYAKTENDYTAFVSGISNGGANNVIRNSYNVGNISSNGMTSKIAGIDTGDEAMITNSYYLQNSNYNVVNDGAKTNEELLDKSTYENWDFDNIWYMGGTYPVLRTFPVDATDIKLDLFSNIINTNSEYEYDLIIEPYGNKDQVEIENLTPELITIKNNKIVTGKNEGKAQIKLSIGDKSFIKEYNLVDLIKYSYNKEFTNKDVDIKFDIKYYQNDLSNGYLELIYNDNVIKIDTNTKNVDVKVSNNETINYKLKVCMDTCKEIYSDVIEITNIDKERPIVKSSYKNKELLINITDEISGIKATKFLYGISDSDVNIPKEMKEFNNNKIISNVTMNYKNKYLWIKNIYDEAGNGLCDSEYCVYDLDIKRNKYSVRYYDEDRKTLIKKEEYFEDEKIKVIEYEKEDSNYYYELSSWEGYQEDLVITKDIELYAKYNKTSKQIKSDKYKVENNYIKNIMLSNIYNKYSYKDFISNISQKEGFLMYENNNIISPEYIKTGMIYKNKYKEYKIVLTGDVTGDGLVKMNDIMMIANHLIDNNTLMSEYFYAADLTNDDKVKMNDLMKLANIMISGGKV